MSNQYPYTQSLGRALRSTGADSLESEGTIWKKFLFDFESQDVTSYRTIKILKTRDTCTHYAEYYRDRTGPLPAETYWKKHNGAPTLSDSYRALNIIRTNEDGTYEYTKKRNTGEQRKLTDQETVWFLLNV